MAINNSWNADPSPRILSIEENLAGHGFDLGRSMARSEALYDMMGGFRYEKTVKAANDKAKADAAIQKKTENKAAGKHADEQSSSDVVGNEADVDKTLTASEDNKLFLGGNNKSDGNETWGEMTIVSNTYGSEGSGSGHAWLELISKSGVVLTMSLWDNVGKGSEDLIINREKDKNMQKEVSRTRNITNLQFQTVLDLAFKNREWRTGFTCAGFSSFIWNKVTGEKLNAHESFMGMDITTPRRLQTSIINWNKTYPLLNSFQQVTH